MDLLFDSEHGLGLEICRYNIGGSGWDNKDTGNFRYGADIPRLASPPLGPEVSSLAARLRLLVRSTVPWPGQAAKDPSSEECWADWRLA